MTAPLSTEPCADKTAGKSVGEFKSQAMHQLIEALEVERHNGVWWSQPDWHPAPTQREADAERVTLATFWQRQDWLLRATEPHLTIVESTGEVA